MTRIPREVGRSCTMLGCWPPPQPHCLPRRPSGSSGRRHSRFAVAGEPAGGFGDCIDYMETQNTLRVFATWRISRGSNFVATRRQAARDDLHMALSRWRGRNRQRLTMHLGWMRLVCRHRQEIRGRAASQVPASAVGTHSCLFFVTKRYSVRGFERVRIDNYWSLWMVPRLCPSLSG